MPKKIDVTRLTGRWVEICKKYMAENNLKQEDVANEIKMQRSHFCAALNSSKSRPLTPGIIDKCIIGGIFKVKDIYDGKAESDEERAFWNECEVSQRKGLIKLLGRAVELGELDFIERMLKNMYGEKKE